MREKRALKAPSTHPYRHRANHTIHTYKGEEEKGGKRDRGRKMGQRGR